MIPFNFVNKTEVDGSMDGWIKAVAHFPDVIFHLMMMLTDDEERILLRK